MQFSSFSGLGLDEGQADSNGHIPKTSAKGDFQHPMSLEEFRKNAHDMVDFICDYARNVEGMPVRSSVQPGYLAELVPDDAPATGEAWLDIMSDVRQKIMPGLTHWQSPNFFGYYPCNSSFPGLLGEMLCAGFATQNFSWIGSPAATELESIVLDWLGKLLHLPRQFLVRPLPGISGSAVQQQGKGGGVIQGTASEACLVTLLAARGRTMEGRPAEDALKLVAYTSDQAHSSVKKACMIAGIRHARLLQTSGDHAWAMQPEKLDEAVKQDLKDGLLPFFVCGTVGSTSTCAVDPVRGLGQVARRHNLWLHIDAAYAGNVAILPELRKHFDGLELADSFNCNPHKWLLTNFDCSTLWVADAEPLKQALSLTPAYLRAQGNALDYKDWQIPLGRRFRALKLWFVLRTYGQQGLQQYLRHHLRLAGVFEQLVTADSRFELTAPPKFGLVCFALKGASNAENAELLEAINRTGKAFLVHTEVSGRLMLRFALGSTHVQQRHVEAAWQVISEEATRLQTASRPAGQ